MLTDSEKIKAIATLLRNGDRSDEWAEAGLLNAIEKIVENKCDGSSESLELLIREASDF